MNAAPSRAQQQQQQPSPIQRRQSQGNVGKPAPKPAVPAAAPKPAVTAAVPAVTPKPAVPAAVPAVAPKPAAPVVTPKPAVPAATPKPAALAATPKPAVPAAAPKPAVPAATPKPAVPAAAPKQSVEELASEQALESVNESTPEPVSESSPKSAPEPVSESSPKSAPETAPESVQEPLKSLSASSPVLEEQEQDEEVAKVTSNMESTTVAGENVTSSTTNNNNNTVAIASAVVASRSASSTSSKSTGNNSNSKRTKESESKEFYLPPLASVSKSESSYPASLLTSRRAPPSESVATSSQKPSNSVFNNKYQYYFSRPRKQKKRRVKTILSPYEMGGFSQIFDEQRPPWVTSQFRGGLFHTGLLEQERQQRLYELAQQLKYLEAQRKADTVAMLPLNEKAYSFLTTHSNFSPSPSHRNQKIAGFYTDRQHYYSDENEKDGGEYRRERNEDETIEGEQDREEVEEDKISQEDADRITAVSLLKRFLENASSGLPAAVIDAATRHLQELEGVLAFRIANGNLQQHHHHQYERHQQNLRNREEEQTRQRMKQKQQQQQQQKKQQQQQQQQEQNQEEQQQQRQPVPPAQQPLTSQHRKNFGNRSLATIDSPRVKVNASSLSSTPKESSPDLRSSRLIDGAVVKNRLSSSAEGQLSSTKGSKGLNVSTNNGVDDLDDDDFDDDDDDDSENIEEQDADGTGHQKVRRVPSRALVIEEGHFVLDRQGLRISVNGIESLPDDIPIPSARPSYEPIHLERLQVVTKLDANSPPTAARSTMWLARDAVSGHIYALKYYSVRGHENRATMHTELVALFEMAKRSSFVVQPADAFLDCGHLRVAALMEYCEFGSLQDIIAVRGIPGESVISAIMRQVMSGLEFVHGRGRVYANLCLEHVLVTARGDIRLCNMSRCKRVGDPEVSSLFRGNERYSSPEMLLGLEVGSPSDVWAMGLLCCELATGDPTYSPDQCPSMIDFKAMVVEGQIGNEKLIGPKARSSQFSLELRQFASDCLARFPRKRATIKELQSYPLFKMYESGTEHITAWCLGIQQPSDGKSRNFVSQADVTATTYMAEAAPVRFTGAAPLPRGAR